MRDENLQVLLDWKSRTPEQKKAASAFLGCDDWGDTEAGVARQVAYYEKERGPLPRVSKEEQLRELDRMNAEVDRAQDKLLADHRKRAVKTFSSIGGAGVRVETFVLKCGGTVTCRILVTDAGKAVDCK